MTSWRPCQAVPRSLHGPTPSPASVAAPVGGINYKYWDSDVDFDSASAATFTVTSDSESLSSTGFSSDHAVPVATQGSPAKQVLFADPISESAEIQCILAKESATSGRLRMRSARRKELQARGSLRGQDSSK